MKILSIVILALSTSFGFANKELNKKAMGLGFLYLTEILSTRALCQQDITKMVLKY